MPKSYIIRAATGKELERIKEFQEGCPDFGHRNLLDGWTTDTLQERSEVLLDYIDEFADTGFYEALAYTKGWNDYTDLSISSITRRAQPLLEYVLEDPAWLGTSETSDNWGGVDSDKKFKFTYIGLIRLLCSVRGIQDGEKSWSSWFTEYKPTDRGFFGINGCDGDNKCHTVPLEKRKFEQVEKIACSTPKHITNVMIIKIVPRGEWTSSQWKGTHFKFE
tara:strand:+ start:180 stop:839 length:660 start_codon:yes stop_codon:yes gene_type:complete